MKYIAKTSIITMAFVAVACFVTADSAQRKEHLLGMGQTAQ